MKTWQILSIFFITACSLSPNTSRVTVKIESRHLLRDDGQSRANRGGSAYAPTAANTFQCYFASISGEGITPTYSIASQLSGLAPQCSHLALGVVSSLVSATELATGVQLTVPSGNNRTIRVFGVNSNLGGACSSKTLADIFSTNSWGSIFEVGKKTQSLLLGDDVNMGTPTFNTTSFDLAAVCSSRGIMPLLAVYTSAVSGTDTAAFLPPAQSVSYTLLARGANASFPIKGGVGGVGNRQSYHFVFMPPRTNKSLSDYKGVRFYSSSATTSTGTMNSGVCSFSKGNSVEYSVPLPGLAVAALANIGEAFSVIPGGALSPTSLENLLHSNSDDSTNDIPGGNYAHLTFYSASNRALVCQGLTIDDLLAVASE